MTPEQQATARLLAAHPAFPSPGSEFPWVTLRAESGILWLWIEDVGHLPDLTDYATGGVLLGMLPDWYTVECRLPDQWRVEVEDPNAPANELVFYGNTLAYAAALAWLAVNA